MTQERGAVLLTGQEEGCEFLGEDVVRSDRIPHVACELVETGRRRGNRAEAAVGHVFDLVVVVEHDSIEAGQAEILEQQVAGEDVDGCELANRVSVFLQRMLALGCTYFLEVEVE